jgi:cyclophilin family peptidyl-prolyl cis-trans isomerase
MKWMLFFKKHVVLILAALAAGISMFWNPPCAATWGYLDWNVLSMLFCLMAVVAGFRKIGVFQSLADVCCKHLKSTRIVEDFMAQGGDPSGNGTGGSEKTIKGEFSQNGVDNPLSHTRGVVSMARSSDPDSASSQFFICYSDDDTFLDGQYAAFGKVTEGIVRIKGNDKSQAITAGSFAV